MKTAKILSFTTLVAMVMGACAVSLAEEVKDSSTTEIVSVEGSDLQNDDALRVAVGDFDDVEFLLSAEDMEAIADNVYISFNGVSAKGGEGSGSSISSAEASGQVETTENSSTTFSGALTLASATSEMVTTSVSSVAMSLSSDKSTEQYATGAGKSYYEQVSTSNSGSAVTTYSATSFLGNSNSVGDGDGSYGTSTIDSGIVPFAASSRTWTGNNGDTNWSTGGNWSSTGWNSGDNATFNATGGENTTVTVDEAITAAKITVTGNTEYIFIYEEGATLTATGNVTIGDSSGTGSLTITGGTTAFNGQYTYVGYSGTGSLTITGGETTFKNTASSSTGYTYVGNGNASGDGTLTIGSEGYDDDDLTVTFSDTMRIGHNGATGTLIINSGTTTFEDKVYLGANSSGTGTITINGGANEFDGQVYIGGSGTSNSGTGYVTISGGENTFKGEVDVGYKGAGTLTITDGTNTFEGKVYLAYCSDTTGTITIEGGKNTFNSQVYLGGSSSSSSYKGGAGEMTISGGENTFNADVYFGYYGTGTLTITEGTNTFEGKVYLADGGNSSYTGTITISGGNNTFKTEVDVGDGGTGSLTIESGTTIFEGAINIGNSTSYGGTVTIAGGTTTIKGATTIANTKSSLSVSGGTVYLETKIGTSKNGTVTISDNANIVLSGELLEGIEALANGGTTAVDVICANTITFGGETFSSNFENDDAYNTLINQYISAEGYDLTWKYDKNSGVLSVVTAVATVAPEPSMFGLFFGLGAIGLVATRRRRRKA